jgi:ketosteroid isomerase-like protein
VTARDEILDVIATYAQAVDDRDIERIVGCFTTDGRIEFEGGQLTGVGHDGIRQAFETAFTRPVFTPPAASTHLMANTLVTVEGDAARAETQAVAFLASGALGTVTTRGLRYRDRLCRDASGWRIAHRVHRSLWQTEASGKVQNSS